MSVKKETLSLTVAVLFVMVPAAGGYVWFKHHRAHTNLLHARFAVGGVDTALHPRAYIAMAAERYRLAKIKVDALREYDSTWLRPDDIDALEKDLKAYDEEINERSVGVATMEDDGTLNLQLRSQDGAEGKFHVRPGDKEYQPYLRHLGGLKPGQSKPVPPWPDAK